MRHVQMHFRDLRLRNNAGMDFPACYASAPLLDTDKGRLPTTTDPDRVTCRRCYRLMRANGYRPELSGRDSSFRG